MRIVVERALAAPMRDGVELTADVHLPDGRGPFPALLQRVPYGRESSRIADGSLDVRRAVLAGYAVVVQDTRGRFASGGSFRPFLDDAADGADSVAWTAAQPWCDGRVGMAGASYGGFVQWAAAGERPAALRAIAPFVATPDPYDGWIHRDGVFELGFNLHWALRNIAPVAAARLGGARAAAAVAANDRVEELYRRVPLGDQPDLAELAPFYGEWLAEPVPDGSWGRLRPAAGACAVPALSIGGWYDVFQRGTLGGHASGVAASVPRRLVVGPWAHALYGGTFPERSFGIAADSAVVDLTKLQLRWFDRWVRDEPNGAERDPEARLFVMGADYWRDEAAWPPPDAEPTEWFLAEGGTLGRTPGADGEGGYAYDPRIPVPTCGGATFLPGLHLGLESGPRDQRAVEARPDVLTYTSEPLERAVEVVGPVSATLFVSSTAPDTDFVVTLTDVAPDGRSLNVADGIVRARYRDGRDLPKLLVPGRTYELTIDLGGTAYVFRPAHRIRVDVASGSFPRWERNPQTGGLGADECGFAIAENRVHHGRSRPSRIVLPLVERAETLERIA